MARPNLDIYVTGSNSRLLSKDVATNFRDRGCEIRLHPLSFSEFYEYAGIEKADAWEEYMAYGGSVYLVRCLFLARFFRQISNYFSDRFRLVAC